MLGFERTQLILLNRCWTASHSAVQALEAPHGGSRMVGVITHLPELAERLPARLRVENDGGRARVVVG